MTENNTTINPETGRRVLVPREPVTEERPQVSTNPPVANNDSNRIILHSNREKQSSGEYNMNNKTFADELRELHLSMIQESKEPEPDNNQTPAPKLVESKPNEAPISKKNSGTKGNFFFKLPLQNPPVGGKIHCLKWNNPSNFDLIESSGSTADYIRHNNWHLNGASIWMGTTASGANESVGTNPASGVTGLIPQAVKHIIEMIKTSTNLSPRNGGLDEQGRPYQFGVIAVIGGQDHASIERQMDDLNMNRSYGEAFKELGVQGISLRGALYNEMGRLFALEVSFTNKEKFGHGRHLIFLHPANDIGGGKSDESLKNRRLSGQVSSLAKEFDWWISALERGGGKIGAIETTLGGTARIGRYALLAARLPRTLIAADAFEAINLDRADWVKENLSSQIDDYRINVATTLLRTVWGRVGERLEGFPVVLVDRHDRSMITVRRMRAIIAIMRHMFLGNPQIDLLRGDISDERIAIQRESAITHNKSMAITDQNENKRKRFESEQNRRIRLSTCLNVSSSKILKLARNSDPNLAIDDAESTIEKLNSLVTSRKNSLPNVFFTVVDALVPHHLLESKNNGVTPQTVEKAMEALISGFKANGIQKILLNLYILPKGLAESIDEVVVQISDDQPGVNVLMCSTAESNVQHERVIMKNPKLDSISIHGTVTVKGFGRHLQRMVEAHLESGYHHCEEDGKLILQFYRTYFQGKFGHRPDLVLGGYNRKRDIEQRQETRGE
ncbi:hypothetical protein OAU99_01605 [Candidatus Poseidoniaceae archaeon]|nr:hypothetical protein [Candidatus Poseidoniaceae archaeon]